MVLNLARPPLQCRKLFQETKSTSAGAVCRQPPSYHSLSADTISKKMFDIVDEVNVVFQLPTPYVRLLLIACKWDKEKLLERLERGVRSLPLPYFSPGTMQETRRCCLERLM